MKIAVFSLFVASAAAFSQVRGLRMGMESQKKIEFWQWVHRRIDIAKLSSVMILVDGRQHNCSKRWYINESLVETSPPCPISMQYISSGFDIKFWLAVLVVMVVSHSFFTFSVRVACRKHPAEMPWQELPPPELLWYLLLPTLLLVNLHDSLCLVW
jgi:hypothetical protein